MPNEKEAKPIKQQTLAEVIRAAKEAGMTYGKYVLWLETEERKRERAKSN